MTPLAARFRQLDAAIVSWMTRYGVQTLRVSLGVIYFWFGVLKFFPGLSPAENLAQKTIATLTWDFVSPEQALLMLALWESLIGLGLVTGLFLRGTLFLLWVQMLGTMTPLILFPQDCFRIIPIVPTMEGQYIVKNLVLISAGIAIGATVRRRGVSGPEWVSSARGEPSPAARR